MEEEKYLKKKYRDLQSQDEKKKETYKHQLDFLKKLEDKYNELQTETGEEAEIEITYKDEDTVVVKDKAVLVKKPEPYKNVYKSVKDHRCQLLWSQTCQHT